MGKSLDQKPHNKGYKMAKKHIKRASTLLAIRAMKLETQMGYHFTPNRINDNNNNNNSNKN